MRHKLTLLLACACAFAALAGAATLRADPGPNPPELSTTTTTETTTTQEEPAAGSGLSAEIVQNVIQRQRRETWRWERVMGHPLTRELKGAPADPQARIGAWQRLAARMRRRAQNPPHKQAWLCIHQFEGAWDDPNAPYYGGLQMDLSFQRRYGEAIFRRKGTADHWTPLEQIWTAERAHRSGRGFYPWPNTARYCGLI